MRFRITVRGDGVELRGRFDDYKEGRDLGEFSESMQPWGVVVASPAEDDYDPFTESGSVWDQGRLRTATQEAAHWKQQAANLQDVLDSMVEQNDIPVLRRLIMQRREIRVAWNTANAYRRRWRASIDALGTDGTVTAADTIEKALRVLSDPTKKTSARVAEARKVLEG